MFLGLEMLEVICEGNLADLAAIVLLFRLFDRLYRLLDQLLFHLLSVLIIQNGFIFNQLPKDRLCLNWRVRVWRVEPELQDVEFALLVHLEHMRLNFRGFFSSDRKHTV